jgi:putative ABC transport system permease protein
VTEDYFRVTGTTLIRGRAFGAGDREGAPRVAIVNHTLARRVWGDDDPIGKRIRLGAPDGPWTTIVGLVGDARHESLEAEPRGIVYRPFAQEPTAAAFVAVRAAVEPGGLVTAIRREVAALDRGLAVHDVATLRQRLSDATAGRRFNTALVSAFGLVALLLAGIGLYGVMAYAVTERTRELGIRIAIGAAPRQVRALVLRQGLAMAVAGIVLGIAGALALGGLLRGTLYGVAATDAVTFAAVPLVLLAVSALACEMPARSATRVDPSVALRSE